MVFLVGGAGNGKSKLAADTVQAVNGTFIGEEHIFAQRTYLYSLKNGGRLRVINDATIPPADRHVTPLVRDLVETIGAGDHLLACINRGVLIGETGNVDPSLGDCAGSLASHIVKWLLSGSISRAPESELRLDLLSQEDAPSHYSIAEIRTENTKRAVVHVVYMDSASLLEPWPDAEEVPGDYRCPIPFKEISVTPVLSPERQTVDVAFQACMSEAAQAYAQSADFDSLDPIGGNAWSLSQRQVARGWCSLMRGAEIIAGTHFTYRELWALFSHSVVGPVTGDGLEPLASWVRERLVKVRTATGEDRLAALLGLGALRTHMLLFDAGRRRPTDPSGVIEEYGWPSTESEALHSANLADPLRHFGPANSSELTDLAQRLSSIEEGHLPGSALSAEDEGINACWTALDAEIEKVIRDEVDPQNDMSSLRKRNELLGWYGRYMYRLVGLARGWPAFCTIVDKWQNAWLDAKRNRRLSFDLQEAILDIVAPTSERGAETFFTFMKSRVDTGEAAVQRAMVAVPRNQLEVGARTDGDRVEVEIGRVGYGDASPAAAAALDFHLLREASARSNGYGFTDSLMLIEPRVERIRASIVAYQLSQPKNFHRFKFSHRHGDVVTS